MRPSLSDSCPKNSAPMTSPIRYQVAMSATALADMCSVLVWVRVGPTLLAMVISSPSKTHATPSATTNLVWNLDHGSRSIRAGIRLRIPGLAVSGVAVIAPLLVALSCGHWRPPTARLPRKRTRNPIGPEKLHIGRGASSRAEWRPGRPPAAMA